MHDSPAAPPPAVGTSWRRRTQRVGLILLVLAAEFSFVIWAFQLDGPVQDRRVEIARVQAFTQSVHGGADPALVQGRLGRAADRLVDLNTPGAEAVASAVGGDLTSSRGRAALTAAVQDSARAVQEQQRERDWWVAGLLLGMFLLVCAGWFTWFRKLAVRHRATQEQLTRHEVRAAGEHRLQALVRNSVDVVAVLQPDSTMSFVTPSATEVLGRDPEDLVGRRFAALVMPDDRAVLARLLAHSDGAEQDLSLRATHPDGRVLSLEGTLKDVQDDPAVLGWVLTIRDVSEKRALEQDLAYQAFHDALTGLANRQLLADRLEHGLLRREKSLDALSVLVVDLDDFTAVNDSLGHDAGDQVLLEAARRLRGALRPGDTVARLGGDEFGVLLDGVDSAGAVEAAERLLDAIARPFDVAGEQVRVRASVGLAVLEPGAANEHHLLRDADTALHEAKADTRAGFVVYDPSMRTRTLDGLQLRADLALAVARDELLLHFQPTVLLATQEVAGFEALVRWQHPVRGLVPPVEFVPVAEESGLIVELGTWVLHEACRAAALMQREGCRPSMAVNVATAQLCGPGFADEVLAALQTSGLPPDRLVLEITETSFLDDLDRGVEVLTWLRTFGIRVAIDDFGTGYSSLAQLSALPIDVLKVDKAFVDRLGGEAADASLVEAILTMSSAMGLVSVAEGVEDEEQARWLSEHHATLGQGYLWSRPVPLAQARQLLRDGVHAVEPAPVVGLASLRPR